MRAYTVTIKNIRKILVEIILTMIIIGIMVSPVMAYKTNWTPATPFPPGFNKSVMKPFENAPIFNFSTLPIEERKITADLLYLLYPDRIAMNVSSKDPAVNLQNAIINLQNAKLYRPGTVTIQDGVKNQATPDLVFLDITLWPGNSTHILDPYIYEKHSSGVGDGLSAWIEVSNIEKIARMPEVRLIDTVPPIYFNIGGHETEGNSTLHAKEVIELPETSDGEGMRVGVISDGVNHIAEAIDSDDLPNITIGNEGNGEEGTALLEIIHDLAPNASLFFYGVDESRTFRDAVDYLVNNAHCNIICDDISLPSEPYFLDGDIVQQINGYSASKNILFISSAGNYAQQHYQGSFVSQANNTLRHDFTYGSYPPLQHDLNYPDLYATLNQGENISVHLQWDDPWSSSMNDYNLFLRNAADGTILNSSTRYQGWFGEPPYERIIQYSANTTMEATITVEKANAGVQDKTLELFIEKDNGIHYYNIIPSDSVFGHSASDQVISTGAVDWTNTNTIEYFSSQGPVTIQYPSYLTRNKPDITGVDNVTISGAGNFGYWDGSNWRFKGTSASSPHIAGIAALLWGKDPTKPATEIKSAILNNAESRTNSNQFGSGLANASKAYYTLYPTPTVTGITPATGLNTGSVSITNLSGSNFNTSATVTLTRTGQPDVIATNVQVLSSSQITCTLPLSGKSAGQWNVYVTNPGGNRGVLIDGFTITAPNPGNTPIIIDPSTRNTFDGQYLSSRGFGWVDQGGADNSYFKITMSGLDQNHPVEFHLKDDFTTKTMYGILVQGSYVTISGVDLSTSPNADRRPVHTITQTYSPMMMYDAGVGAIVVNAHALGVNLVNIHAVSTNFPGVFVDSSDVIIIGTNNPDPYLTTYTGAALNDAWGSTVTSLSLSGYGMGLMEQTTTRSSWVSVVGDGGTGIHITGPFSGIELNGKTATFTGGGSGIHINGTGTVSGTGSDRNSGITAWGGSHVLIIASNSSITGQEYGGYSQGGSTFGIICPSCSIDPIQSTRGLRALSNGTHNAGISVVGGIHGLFLTGPSSGGTGNITIDNITVQGRTGYGVDLSQASGYAVTITNPSGILGGMGKLGTSGSSSNTITAGSVLITTGATGPYPVNISLNTIPGPDPYNLKICNESGSVVYDITDWDVLPAGVTYNSATRMVSFWSDTLQIYSVVKYAHSNTTLTVKSIEPSSGLSGQTIRITNLSGTFSPAAVSTGVILTRSGTTIPASNVTVESADRITGNLSIPSGAENGPWQVIVEQDGQVSDGNVTFTVIKDTSAPAVTTLPAENITPYTALISGNLTYTGGEPCTVFFRYGTDPVNLSVNTSPVIRVEPGIFNASISGLIPDTTWYYAAFAHNTAGLVQGVTVNFTWSPVHPTPVVYSIHPSSGSSGTLVSITNLSGVFNTTAHNTDMVLTRSGAQINATNVTVDAADKITGIFSLPPSAQAGPWQVTVQQDGQWSSENVTFIVETGRYLINATASPGGQISPSGPVSVPVGSNLTFTMSADSGYHLMDLRVDNASIGAFSAYTFSNVSLDHTISAEFSANGTVNYSVSAFYSSGGQINPSGPVSIPAGSNQTFTLIADPGYHIRDLLVDNASVGALSAYTFFNVSSNHSISAGFSENETLNYSISAGSSSGGQINPSGPVSIPAGSNQTFTLIADSGYHIRDLLVDNSSVGALSAYTFFNVSSNHSIYAGFSENGTVNYSIISVSSFGGQISPSGQISVPAGFNQTFTLVADPGYHIMDLLVDNASVGPLGTYTFSHVSTNHRIEAVFTMVILPPVVSGVTPTSGQQNTMVNLVISGQNFSGNEQIDLVRNGTANLTRIGTLSGNNLVVSGLNLSNAPVGLWDLWVTNLTTRMSGVKKDAFTVTGGQKPFYTITTKSDNYGWITPSGQIKVKAGSRKQFTMHTVRGAEIENVTVDGIPVTLDHHKEYTFMRVTADHMLCLNTKPYGDQVIANFTVNQTSGQAPLMVRFTDTSSGSPAQWLWNFGDGKISTLQNPVHTYKKQGWYSVRLTARNGKSVDTKMVNRLIRVTGGRGSLSESEEEETGISTPVPVISSTGTPLVVKTGRQVISGSDILSVSPVLPGQREVLTTG